jgi:diguanylate cyclase (GGDEF)-like protein
LVASIAASGTQAALLFIDADRIKSVNDIFGHSARDAVLQNIAKTISAVIREADVAAGIGGERFAVFLAGASEQAATEVAERLRTSVQERAGDRSGLPSKRITVSIGIRCVKFVGESLDRDVPR